jgi:MFS family permease
MFLLYTGTSVYAVYAASVLHGFNFMLPYYFMVILIDKHTPDNLKATAQTLHSVFRYSVAALAGNLGGGALADIFSLRQVFLVLSVMAFGLMTAVPGVGVLIYRLKKKEV